LCYSSFLGLDFGGGCLSNLKKKNKRLVIAPVREKKVTFSDAHRKIMSEFIYQAEYTSEERELMFEEVSKEFEKRGIEKISKRTFMSRLKVIAADLFSPKEDGPFTAEDEDAVGALLFLRDNA
jgi:hypothetical protein